MGGGRPARPGLLRIRMAGHLADRACALHCAVRFRLMPLPQEGVESLGEEGWQVARVLAGRPAVGAELTEDANPLEAGLYGAVSLTKGCYLGQETLAKVHRLGAVKQQLWGVELEAPVAVGDAVLPAGAAAGDAGGGMPLGRVTSYADTPSGAWRWCERMGAGWFCIGWVCIVLAWLFRASMDQSSCSAHDMRSYTVALRCPPSPPPPPPPQASKGHWPTCAAGPADHKWTWKGRLWWWAGCGGG